MNTNNFFLNFLKKEDPFSMMPKEQLEKIHNRDIMPRPNDDVEFIVPLFDARKHYKHLKKMMWKYQRR